MAPCVYRNFLLVSNDQMLTQFQTSDMTFPIMEGYIRTDQKCKYCGSTDWVEINSGGLKFRKCPAMILL